MMQYTAQVRLHWLVDHRMTAPRGKRFARPARFDHQGTSWTAEAWSLCIEVDGVPDTQGNQCAVASFLVADAPHQWLGKGAKFTLFEGKLALAEGEVH